MRVLFEPVSPAFNRPCALSIATNCNEMDIHQRPTPIVEPPARTGRFAADDQPSAQMAAGPARGPARYPGALGAQAAGTIQNVSRTLDDHSTSLNQSFASRAAADPQWQECETELGFLYPDPAFRPASQTVATVPSTYG